MKREFWGFDFFYGNQWNRLEVEFDELNVKAIVNGKEVKITNPWTGSIGPKVSEDGA